MTADARPGELSELDRFIITSAIEQQIHRFAKLNDSADWPALVSMFTENASFARPTAPDKAIIGRAALLKFFTSRPPRKGTHLMTNVTVDVESPTSARAHSYILLFMGGEMNTVTPAETTMVGGFTDVLEKVDGNWLFASRLGSLMYMTDTPAKG